MKFYLVDDDSDFVDVMTALLEAAGHTVFADIAALPAISRIVTKRPDCIITDMMMSEMNGLELCAELRRRDELKNTVIIMVSAKIDDHWRNRANEAGADGFVDKPLNVETFVGQVEEIIAGGPRKTSDAPAAPEHSLPGRR
ncbi:MAG: response regulator [Alphaproteobacteria bacterium]|nr:response regulator [Alphaproteobacteria bacterium]